MLRTIEILLFTALTLSAQASSKVAIENATVDVAKIARAISLVQPFRSDEKYVSHALSIYRASRRYGVDPAVLIAIAQQETSFREDLPEGRAGELGICQVLKGWANNENFRAEFGHVKRKDFLNSEKSFLFAAWILKELRKEDHRGALPYWSFYNARKFAPRLRYFIGVSRFLSQLKKNEHEFKGMGLPFLVADHIHADFTRVKRVAKNQWSSPHRFVASNALTPKRSMPSRKAPRLTMNASVGALPSWLERIAQE